MFGTRFANSTTFIISILIFIIAPNLYAYQFGSKPKIPGFDPVHEAFTRNALACMSDPAWVRGMSCIQEIKVCLDKFRDNKKQSITTNELASCYEARTQTDHLILDTFTSDELEEATRWPDDPTNEAKTLGALKFANKMSGYCKKLLKNKKQLTLNDGFLCNSHYGPLQFWHAQASTLGESSMETHEKIKQWVLFNYKLAIGSKEFGYDDDYCTYFKKYPSAISIPMTTGNQSYCTPSKSMAFLGESIREFFNIDDYPAFKISTLYGLTCNKIASSAICKEKAIMAGDAARERLTRLNAIGALLHVVQDSYSQSHTQRGTCEMLTDQDRTPVSKIECKNIDMYTTYAYFDSANDRVVEQGAHKPSDRWPVIADSCKPNSVNDPITASATMLSHIDQTAPSSVEEMMKDFDKIFAAPVSSAPESEFGACYPAKP